MPELPDVLLYQHRIAERIVGESVRSIWISSISVLKTFEPKPAEFVGLECTGVDRIGKRILIQFSGGLTAVVHPMVAGRFVWDDVNKPNPRDKDTHFGLDFPTGRLMLKEFGHKKRAQLHLFRTVAEAKSLNRGGIDIFAATTEQFEAQLKRENRTLKRRLTDPSAFDGIGNTYSDEILWAAKISPIKLTQSLDSLACTRLHESAKTTMIHWTEQLERCIPGFPNPKQITAFRPDFAVHGRWGKPCPRCESPVQRIVYADNECNYCAVCQNGGVILADRSLSRLLKDDWPRSIEDWEQKFG